MALTYVAIATTTVGSGGAANITFSSIPQTYTDLLVLLSARSEGTDGDSFFTINANSGANYSYRRLSLSDNTVTTNSSSGATGGYWAFIPPSTYTSNTFGNVSLYIPNYTSSNNKSFSVDGVSETNSTNTVSRLVAGLWAQTSAITSLEFTTYGADLEQYSTATLYGIKNTV